MQTNKEWTNQFMNTETSPIWMEIIELKNSRFLKGSETALTE